MATPVQPTAADNDDLLERMQGLNITGMDYSSQFSRVKKELNLDVRFHTRDFFKPENEEQEVKPPGLKEERKTIPIYSIRERFEDLTQIFLDVGDTKIDNSPAYLLRPLFNEKFHEFTNRQFVVALLAPIMKNNQLVLRFEFPLSLKLSGGIIKWRPDFVIFT